MNDRFLRACLAGDFLEDYQGHASHRFRLQDRGYFDPDCLKSPVAFKRNSFACDRFLLTCGFFQS